MVVDPVLTVDPAAVDPVPWANGAGTTRELARVTEAEGVTVWRVSVADLERSAPFSSLPGLDRIFVPLGLVRLTIDGTSIDVEAGEQVRFPGEAVVAVVLSRPTRALNVMTRRGRCVAQVALRPADAPARGEGTVSVDLGERIAEVRVTIAPRL